MKPARINTSLCGLPNDSRCGCQTQSAEEEKPPNRNKYQLFIPESVGPCRPAVELFVLCGWVGERVLILDWSEEAVLAGRLQLCGAPS